MSTRKARTSKRSQASFTGVTYLRIPIRNVFIAFTLTFLTKCSNNITKSAQTLVDVLRLLQPLFVPAHTTRVESL